MKVYFLIPVVLVVLFIVFSFLNRKRKRRIRPAYFASRWQELQKYCATRKTWPLAIVEADDLLCEALKKRGYKGKTTGERLVAAQHELTENDSVWYGHKLRNKITEIDVRKLKKQDVISALAGFRQALRDLGALK